MLLRWLWVLSTQVSRRVKTFVAQYVLIPQNVLDYPLSQNYQLARCTFPDNHKDGMVVCCNGDLRYNVTHWGIMLAFIFLTVGEPPVRHEWIWLNGSDTTVFLKTCIKQCLRCFAGGIPFIKFKMFTLCATSFFLFHLFFL